MTGPSILVVDNYDSFTWNLVHYLEELGARTTVVRNDALTVDEALARGDDGLLLSPGPRTPADAGICVDLIKAASASLPILGVCLGHQSIGAANGVPVVQSQAIWHGKLSTIHHSDGPLFKGLPDRFDVVRYHSLALRAGDLPDQLIADSFTDDGEVMSLRHASRPVFGVQFHPESIKTEHGHALLKNFLDLI